MDLPGMETHCIRRHAGAYKTHFGRVGRMEGACCWAVANVVRREHLGMAFFWAVAAPLRHAICSVMCTQEELALRVAHTCLRCDSGSNTLLLTQRSPAMRSPASRLELV